MQGDKILAEPAYISLQLAGYEGDGHKLINEEALALSQSKGISLMEALREKLGENSQVWRNMPQKTLDLLGDPRKYTGLAAQKALQIAGAARAYLAKEGIGS